MEVTYRTSNGMIVVTDDLNQSTRTVHKYAVLEDGRRRSPIDGKYSQVASLEDVTVQHSQTVTIHEGRVVAVEWTPDPDASRELVERGATVQLNDDRPDEGQEVVA